METKEKQIEAERFAVNMLKLGVRLGCALEAEFLWKGIQLGLRIAGTPVEESLEIQKRVKAAVLSQPGTKN